MFKKKNKVSGLIARLKSLSEEIEIALSNNDDLLDELNEKQRVISSQMHEISSESESMLKLQSKLNELV